MDGRRGITCAGGRPVDEDGGRLASSGGRWVFSCCVRLPCSEACPKVASWLPTEPASSPATSCPPGPPRSVALPPSRSVSNPPQPTVLFESHSSLRKFILNRPRKLNALDEEMLSLLRPKIEARCFFSTSAPRLPDPMSPQEWSTSDLCGAIIGTGVGRAFCSGGDVASQSHRFDACAL
jgi:hypothetical protein